MGRLLVLLALVLCGHALIHKITLERERAPSLLIETFGFAVGGFQNISNTVPHFSKEDEAKVRRNGFCFMVMVTPSDSSQFIDDTLKLKCNDVRAGDLVFPLSWDGAQPSITKIDAKPKGYWNLYFVNEDSVAVSLKLEVTQKSVGDNFLPVGSLPLGKLYMVMAAVYMALAIMWTFGVLRGSPAVFLIHHLMTGVVLLKMLAVTFESLDFHFQNIVGHPGGWTVAFFVLNAVRGVSMFCIVGLIGSGWQFLKPFLSDKEVQVFLVIVPLQVIDNIALVIIDEAVPGNTGWETWKTIFRIVDIICCAAVIIPIVWSIHHLRNAANASGKMARTLHKLQMFRQFYLIVVAYIYFTRIIVYLFEATLPYSLTWLSDLATESATVAFFCFTGYRFKPEKENPFLKLDSDDEVELNQDGDIDLESMAAKKAATHEALVAEEKQLAALAAAAKAKEPTFDAEL